MDVKHKETFSRVYIAQFSILWRDTRPLHFRPLNYWGCLIQIQCLDRHPKVVQQARPRALLTCSVALGPAAWYLILWEGTHSRCPRRGWNINSAFLSNLARKCDNIHLSHPLSYDIKTFAREACRASKSFDISRGLPREISTFSKTRLAEFWKCWYRMTRGAINVLSHFLWSQIWPGKQNLIKS